MEPLVLTTLVDNDRSVDPDEVRDDLRIELITLNAELKQLNKDWDFSAVLRPLLDDQGPAMPQIPRLTKLKERMTRLRDDFLRKSRRKNRNAKNRNAKKRNNFEK